MDTNESIVPQEAPAAQGATLAGRSFGELPLSPVLLATDRKSVV